VGRHDVLFEEATVRMGEVPPVPNPVESDMTATNLLSPGNGKSNAISPPCSTVFSNITRRSSPCGMNPIGKSNRVNGGEPPSHMALVVVHWEGVEEKWKVNPDEGRIAKESANRSAKDGLKRGFGSKLSFCWGRRRMS
jgi:hypothetical protein